MIRKYVDNIACEKAIQGICKGDCNALSVIYDIMHRPVYSLALSICQNKHDAEDALQNTLCEIVKNASNYKSGNARAWILGVARNCSLRIVSKQKNHLDIEEIANSMEISSPKDALIESYVLFDAMSQLSEDEREIVVMKAVAGLTHKEISSIFGLSVDSCKRTYYRALKQLKSYFNSRSD